MRLLGLLGSVVLVRILLISRLEFFFGHVVSKHLLNQKKPSNLYPSIASTFLPSNHEFRKQTYYITRLPLTKLRPSNKHVHNHLTLLNSFSPSITVL